MLTFSLHAQQREERQGSVTYISAQNVYVKFENTAGISAGDTLFIRSGGSLKPVIIVGYISSRSCAGELINGDKLKVDDKIIGFAKVQESVEQSKQQQVSYFDSLNLSIAGGLLLKQQNKEQSIESIRGRFSIQSYTNMSNYDNNGDYQRWRYTFSFTGDNIGNSPLSVSNYMTFGYRVSDWQEISSDLSSALRIYDLAVNYRFSDKTNLWLGRHLNKRITNISAIDGVQAEHKFDVFSLGLIAGARPDFTNDMALNFKLFEYGAYAGRTDSLKNSVMDNNLAFIQQTNNFNTDRRFLYLQHSNDIIPNTSIFFSSEIDLYKKIKGVESNEFILTGLFLSARYSPHRIASFSLSYDARKNVIYYETFKNFIDSVYENETRHGLRLGVNLRPIDYLSVGLNGGYRYMKGDLRPSRNFNGYLTYTQIPFIEASSTVSYTHIISGYLDGYTAGIRFSKDLSIINSDLSLGYRYTSYDLLSGNSQVIENILLTDLGVRILKNLYLNVGFEAIFAGNRSTGRILADITTRF